MTTEVPLKENEITRYGFLDEVKEGMVVQISTYLDNGSTLRAWMLVDGRRARQVDGNTHVSLVGRFEHDQTPARTEGWASVSILIRETVPT